MHKLSSMTGQHVANQCKQVFSEYIWPETLIFWQWTLLYCECFYQCNESIPHHITRSPYYPQSNWLAEKYVQIVKSISYKAKDEGNNLFKCLMIYHNAPLNGSLQSPMQILQNRCTRSDIPKTNAARQQLVLQPEKLRALYKNEHLPSPDLDIGQDVMYQDVTSKQWHPATISSLCVQPRS